METIWTIAALLVLWPLLLTAFTVYCVLLGHLVAWCWRLLIDGGKFPGGW